MANHGQIACGPDLDSAFSLAKDIEDLSRQYVITLQIGGPKLLDDHEMGSRAQRSSPGMASRRRAEAAHVLVPELSPDAFS
jgi:ribulose-5-phosphate 4-epimerase/fuculose-1-phosphate aldolase